jgi:biotin-(acetyl-CoA carboxylase) ligase
MAHAIALAPVRGAGTLCWVGSAARAEAAVVLEPDLPLAQARLALLAGANALADALAADGPPEIPVQFRWPATLLVNGAACGTLRLAVPRGAKADAVPAWLALGMEVRLQSRWSAAPGAEADRTALADEGWDKPDAAELIGAWARHLLAGLDDWQVRGPAKLIAHYLARCAEPGARGIDPATGALRLALGSLAL